MLSQLRSDQEIASYFGMVNDLYRVEIDLGLPLKDGLLELLSWLRGNGIPCALATTNPRAVAERILEQTGLRMYFAVTVTGDEFANSKPAPEIYSKAADLLSIAPSECIVLEDSPLGVESALAAGMAVIQVSENLLAATGDPPRHLIVQSLRDVAAILKAYGLGDMPNRFH